MKILYRNARVFTGKLPLQEAFLVDGDHFAAVGTEAEVGMLSADKVVDLGGAFVCPGFIDSHMHLLNFGRTLTVAPLSSHTHSLSDMLDCLSKTAPGRGGWIFGRGWNQDYFSDVSRMPNRYDLDRVSEEHPVCAVRACGHALCVNSKALQLLGITRDTPSVEGGEIVLENGEPNGILLDNAMDLLYSQLPPPDPEEIKDMLRAACKVLNTYGITSCHSDDYAVFQDITWREVNKAYHELEESGELTVRLYEQSNFSNLDALQDFLQNGNNTGIGTPYFRIGPLKLLGDGSLGSRTAYLSKPYADAPQSCGLSIFSQDEFDALIDYAHKNGMQVAVHCIGDACLDRVLSSLDKTLAAHPRTDHRHGIVHCQITRPDQLSCIGAMKLNVYAQSIFLDYDLHIVRQRVGDALAASSYSWKTAGALGASVSNGSDCPVELPSVLGGIQCAVTRCDLSGDGPYLPEQAFSVEEALQSFTCAGAWASFEENTKGSIAPGMLADFVVLGANPLDTAPQQIAAIPVLSTFVGGKPVYERV